MLKKFTIIVVGSAILAGIVVYGGCVLDANGAENCPNILSHE